MSGGTRYRLFGVVAPGLEPVAKGELEALGVGDAREVPGGVEWTGGRETLWTLAVRARCLESVRVRIGEVPAPNPKVLADRLSRLAWAAWVPKGVGLVVRVTSRRSTLQHTGRLAELLGGVVEHHRGTHPAVADDPDAVRLHLRLDRDRATVSVDATWPALHRRGERLHGLDVSLRETLAAAVVRLAGLAPGQAVVDPFAGAGTLLLEAFRFGHTVPAGRRFAFERWPTHDLAAFGAVRARLASDAVPPPRRLVALDPDERARGAALMTLAPLATSTILDATAASLATHAPKGAAVLTHPPYGRRKQDRDRGLSEGLRAFGEALAQRPDLGPVLVVSARPRIAEEIGGRWSETARVDNRGTTVRVFRLER